MHIGTGLLAPWSTTGGCPGGSGRRTTWRGGAVGVPAERCARDLRGERGWPRRAYAVHALLRSPAGARPTVANSTPVPPYGRWSPHYPAARAKLSHPGRSIGRGVLGDQAFRALIWSKAIPTSLSRRGIASRAWLATFAGSGRRTMELGGVGSGQAQPRARARPALAFGYASSPARTWSTSRRTAGASPNTSTPCRPSQQLGCMRCFSR